MLSRMGLCAVVDEPRGLQSQVVHLTKGRKSQRRTGVLAWRERLSYIGVAPHAKSCGRGLLRTRQKERRAVLVMCIREPGTLILPDYATASGFRDCCFRGICTRHY